MKVEPVNFNQEHKEMLGHCKLFLEKGYICDHSNDHRIPL
jgi:hypothetical protein